MPITIYSFLWYIQISPKDGLIWLNHQWGLVLVGLRILKRYDTCLGEFSMLIEACGEVCELLFTIISAGWIKFPCLEIFNKHETDLVNERQWQKDWTKIFSKFISGTENLKHRPCLWPWSVIKVVYYIWSTIIKAKWAFRQF